MGRSLAAAAVLLAIFAGTCDGAGEEALLLAGVARCDSRADCLGIDERCFLAHGQPAAAAAAAAPRGLCLSSTRFQSLLEEEGLPAGSGSSFVELGEAGLPGSGTFGVAAEKGQKATLKLGDGYTISVNGDGNLQVVQAGQSEAFLSFGGELSTGAMNSLVGKLQATSLDAAGGFAVTGAGPSGDQTVRQWSLAHADEWDVNEQGVNKTRDWAAQEAGMELGVQSCGGVTMLGGPSDNAAGGLHDGEVSKMYTDLPPHTHVRVVATFHFVDLWLGEAVYLKLNTGAPDSGGLTEDEYVWTRSYHAAALESRPGASGIDVCGDPQVVEYEFSVPVDVAVPHSSKSLRVTFGSRLPPTASSDFHGASWGLSRVEIYVKDAPRAAPQPAVQQAQEAKK